MKLSIFCQFGLKTPIHASRIGDLGRELTPNTGSNITETHKRHTFARRLSRQALKSAKRSDL